ncbi:MAG: ATP-binding cassette domain-containing protein [Bacteroidales bacterium]|nr:ATP-binding cassette domain-containing protein [Bacteroidales bacterium]
MLFGRNIDKEKSTWFISILRKDIKLLAGTLALGVTGAVLGLAVSVFSQKLIDEIIPRNNLRHLVIGLSIAAGLLLLKIMVSYLQQYLGIKHSKMFNLALIDKFFSRVLLLPKAFFDKNSAGGLIARMNDSASIQQTVTFIANTFILNLLILIVSCAVLFHYSAAMGFISLLSFPFYLTVAILNKKNIASKTSQTMEANAIKESSYISTIQNIDLIKTHNKQNVFSNINFDIYSNFQQKSFMLGKTGANLGVTAEFIGTFFYIIMLSFAAYQVITARMTIGEYTATLGIATSMLYPIGSIGMAILHLQGAKVAFERMYEFISLNPEYEKNKDVAKKDTGKIEKIEFRNIRFSYNPKHDLLKDINFTVKKGEVISIFGKNGSGKSTLLNLLMALYNNYDGNILFNNIDLKELSVEKLRDKLAIVSQQSNLFDSSVIQNICFDSDENVINSSIAYLNGLGFQKYIDSISDGYYNQIIENGKNLSGGQKQIISLARALCKRPDILILDEPTASLDGEAENFVLSRIKDYARKGIVIMVTHKIKPARESDRILVLEDGKISNSGTHNELILLKNFYSQRFSELVY